LSYLISCLLGYAIGSITFALLICRFVFDTDIHQKGSGNPGATNVYRCFGWKPALAVLILDILKGVIPTVIIGFVFDFSQLATFCAGGFSILGHIFPVFGLVKGGKGVATAAGVFLVLAPVPLAISFIVYLAILFSLKFGSVASLSAGICLSVCSWLLEEPPVFYFSLIFTCLVFITHRRNIHDLIVGREGRINEREK